MKNLSGILPLFFSLALMVGCASDFQSTESGSNAANDSPPDTSIQDAIDRANAQAASDASNAAAQAAFIAGMAAAQETMNNANNNQAPFELTTQLSFRVSLITSDSKQAYFGAESGCSAVLLSFAVVCRLPFLGLQT